jgi:hypothetical protein
MASSSMSIDNPSVLDGNGDLGLYSDPVEFALKNVLVS